MVVAIPAVLLILALIVAPRLWILSVLRRHAGERADFPGTGGEFARHVLDGMKLSAVKVEETERGDHYHPLAKAVRLAPEHFYGRSLTAIVIAAHEVGHAMQDATGYVPLLKRTQIAGLADFVHKIGAIVVLASPAIAALMRTPAGLEIGVAAGILSSVVAVIMHVFTLPVELDASFNRALLLLKEGRFIPAKDVGAARHILAAAAYTYVASALIDIINLPRWIRGLR
jgi:uncharacterized protein